jgi:hypothetical protein
MRPTSSGGQHDGTQERYQAGLLADRAALALAALAEADPVNAVSDALLVAAPSIQHLSLRNQIMLLIQAGERKLSLRDVDTEQGWARRGREPNQQGLQIVRPRDTGRAASLNPPARPRRARTSFWVDYRWEFVQTVPLTKAIEPEHGPEPAGDPAEFVSSLLEQFGRHGYQVTPGQACAVDHDAATVTVAALAGAANPTVVACELIRAMADVLTSGSDRRYVHHPIAGRRVC